jgi:Txe/YoeB family toxin of Txe-Axe toxin-antitoxin module
MIYIKELEKLNSDTIIDLYNKFKKSLISDDGTKRTILHCIPFYSHYKKPSDKSILKHINENCSAPFKIMNKDEKIYYFKCSDDYTAFCITNNKKLLLKFASDEISILL